MSHTPGVNYTVKTRGHERSALVLRGTEIVSEVFTDTEPGDQYQTAALFAAAPAMLEALQRLTHPMADDDDVEFALAVIARATGG